MEHGTPSTSGRSLASSTRRTAAAPFRLPLQRPFTPHAHTLRRKPHSKHAALGDDDTSSSTPGTFLPKPPSAMSTPSPPTPHRTIDPYRAAGQRLERLLSGLGDGEEELLNMMIMEESVERRVGIALLAGTAISAAACFVCWVCGLDPAGGASLSLQTLRAAALGGVAVLPLVAIKSSLWSDKAQRMLPFLEEVQQRQIEEFQPMLYKLNPAQTLLVLGSEVIPGLLILLPAVIGGISKTLDFYLTLAGVDDPGSLPAAAAVSVAALFMALAKLVELTPTEEEYQTVKDALDNAERFYKIVGQGRDSGVKDQEENARAFRAVAVTWLARRQVASRFAAVSVTAEVLFLGSLWQFTGDFAAPLVAGLASAAVDFAAIRRSMASTPGGDGSGAAF